MTPDQLEELYTKLIRLTENCTRMALAINVLSERIRLLEKENSAKRSLVN